MAAWIVCQFSWFLVTEGQLGEDGTSEVASRRRTSTRLGSKVCSMISQGTALGDFLVAYSTLISIINPFGLAFVFQQMTRGLAPSVHRRLSLRVALYSFCIICASALLGSYILSFFGITLPALRIAGGIAVAFAGWGLPPVTQASVEAMAFYPITMPLTTGPGSVSAAIALVASRPSDQSIYRMVFQIVLVSLSVSITIYLCYRWSAWLSQHMGLAATRIFTRISAFLLLCVGVQIVITGVSEVLRDVIGTLPLR